MGADRPAWYLRQLARNRAMNPHHTFCAPKSRTARRPELRDGTGLFGRRWVEPCYVYVVDLDLTPTEEAVYGEYFR